MPSVTPIQFVDTLLIEALQKSASDIHIEPYQTFCRIRLRQDGILYEAHQISNEFSERIITRLKVLAKLDIAERRLPQDGRLQFDYFSQRVDIRISTCPILFGEKLVLRILNHSGSILTLTDLGMPSLEQELFTQKINAPHGLILISGPTGSGKTMTLYSALHHLNQAERNISTVEDPVEIYLPGINQVNVHTKIGLTFSSLLRTLLRQDPDVIMVGEIRDNETAIMATEAAQTGHLVLSTLHANSAAETFLRLKTLGVNQELFSSTASLIVSQRLVRKLCIRCLGKQCEHCLQGYWNRTGIYEFLSFSNKKFPSLKENALQKVRDGITSLKEVERLLSQDIA